METTVCEALVPDEKICVSFEVTEDKPFNKCFECHSFRNGCSGPNLTVMSIARVCEFLQSARIFQKYSYQDVADGVGVSLATVKRILTGKISDPSFFTLSAIARFLLGDPNGKHPCAIPNVVADLDSEAKLNDAMRDLERALGDNKDYRTALDNIHVSYKMEMETIREEALKQLEAQQEEVRRSREECDRWRIEAEHWRRENDRKGMLIDKYLDKMMEK